MSTPTVLRIGYVPEHFSSPLLLLAARNPDLKLVPCPSGTGQIMSAIKNQEIDVAIALTESLIAGIAKKVADFKIVGTYVTSPLTWAVSVGKNSKYQTLDDLRGEVMGISRIGSGSQVMASYMALREKWVDQNGKVDPVKFKVLDTFKNLRDGVNNGEAAAFMWEHFTTKPYLDQLRFIGQVPTPWHSWVIVATPPTTADVTKRQALENLLSELTKSVHNFDSIEARQTSSFEFVKKTFEYPDEDVHAWLESVKYPTVDLNVVEKETINKTLSILEAAGVLQVPEGGWVLDDFVDTTLARLE